MENHRKFCNVITHNYKSKKDTMTFEEMDTFVNATTQTTLRLGTQFSNQSRFVVDNHLNVLQNEIRINRMLETMLEYTTITKRLEKDITQRECDIQDMEQTLEALERTIAQNQNSYKDYAHMCQPYTRSRMSITEQLDELTSTLNRLNAQTEEVSQLDDELMEDMRIKENANPREQICRILEQHMNVLKCNENQLNKMSSTCVGIDEKFKELGGISFILLLVSQAIQSIYRYLKWSLTVIAINSY